MEINGNTPNFNAIIQNDNIFRTRSWKSLSPTLAEKVRHDNTLSDKTEYRISTNRNRNF